MLTIKIKPRLSALDESLSRLLYLKAHPRRRLHESLSDWAESEVNLALKNNSDPYGSGCLKSALKAFRSLCDDGHSGMSIGITKCLLNRLIDGKPLTSIEDTPDVWNDTSDFWGVAGHYQCNRMSALFKTVAPDGSVSYHDVDRTILVEVYDDGHESDWHSGLADKIVDEVCGPITLPYYPSEKPYKVYAQQFDSVNAEAGCFDTTRIIKIVDPEGNEIPCERFYAEMDMGMEPISKEEYDRRRASYEKAKCMN